ncbi:MAG: lactonase family protein, partial [Deltaproteobacteria bacterium]
MAHEPIAPRGNQIMNRRLRTLTFSLSLFVLAAAHPTHAADGLAYVGTRHDGSSGVNGLRSADALALSPDGADLYAAGSGDSALAVFSRDAASGALTFVEQERQGSFGIEGLGGASAVAVSPDGINVYAAGTQDDSLVVFTRDPADGALFFVERKRDSVDGVDGLAGINAVAVSPDGMNVYATGGADDALATFMRDATTGTLTFLGAEPGLNGPQAIAISPDGAYLYVASGNAVVVFARDPASGMLTVVQIVDDDTDGVDGLGGAAALAVSPDGGHLYAAGKLDDAVAVFSR